MKGKVNITTFAAKKLEKKVINQKIESALNKQINEEFFSSYLYLSMSAYFDSKNLQGFANWMSIQSQEEYQHAMKIYDYLMLKGGTVKLDQIGKPKTEWKNPLEVFTETLEHEQHISKCIYDIIDLALEVKDHATHSFFQWFVTEQVEEEATVMKIVEDLKLIGENSNGIFLLDRELGTRQAQAANAAE